MVRRDLLFKRLRLQPRPVAVAQDHQPDRVSSPGIVVHGLGQRRSFPDTVSGPLYLFVVTDLLNHVYEYAAEDNNSRRADIMVSLSPPPDLVVAGVIAPAAGNSGHSGSPSSGRSRTPVRRTRLRAWSDRVIDRDGARSTIPIR